MKTFYFCSEKYKYFKHSYNNTDRNERCIEVPIVWKFVKQFQSKKILEVGNVLSHYFDISHEIIDKYEEAKNVKNIDINNFKPNIKYDLIVSISTIEHISENIEIIINTFNHLKSMLKKNGKFIITFPIGYNKSIDQILEERNMQLNIFYMKRLDLHNWKQVDYNKIKNIKYGKPFKYGNGIAIIIFEKTKDKKMVFVDLPLFIDIELNTSCNLYCKQCPYKEVHKNPKFMSSKLYKKIIDQIDWKCSFKLCQRGEPLLSSILIEAIEYAHKRGLRTVINTNGYLLRNLTIPLIKSRIDEIILSDYGHQTQLSNGYYFSHMNRMEGYPIWFTVKTNRIEKWYGRADKIIRPTYYDYKDLENEDSTKLLNWKCSQLFEKLIIEPDGKVRCCCGSLHDEKYVGNINENSIKEIWYSKKLNKYRELHLEGRSHELLMCRECGYRKSIVKERENVNIRL